MWQQSVFLSSLVEEQIRYKNIFGDPSRNQINHTEKIIGLHVFIKK